MAITFINSTNGESTTNPHNVSVPTNVDDDVMINFLGYAEFGITFDANDSFTLPADVSHGSAGGTDRQGGWEWKVASSEGANYSIGYSGVPTGARIGAIISSFRGVDNTNVLDVTPTTSHRQEGQNEPSPTNQAITTVTDGAFVILVCLHTGGVMTSYGAPTNYTLADSFTTGTLNMAVAYREIATAGTETPGAWSNSGDAGRDFYTATLALRPFVAAQTGLIDSNLAHSMAHSMAHSLG